MPYYLAATAIPPEPTSEFDTLVTRRAVQSKQ